MHAALRVLHVLLVDEAGEASALAALTHEYEGWRAVPMAVAGAGGALQMSADVLHAAGIPASGLGESVKARAAAAEGQRGRQRGRVLSSGLGPRPVRACLGATRGSKCIG